MKCLFRTMYYVVRNIKRHSGLSLKFIIERHRLNGISKYAEKSKFNFGEDISALIKMGAKHSAEPQGKRLVRTFDVGRNIGIDRVTGGQTSVMTIVTESDGTLVTAFPGVP